MEDLHPAEEGHLAEEEAAAGVLSADTVILPPEEFEAIGNRLVQVAAADHLMVAARVQVVPVLADRAMVAPVPVGRATVRAMAPVPVCPLPRRRGGTIGEDGAITMTMITARADTTVTG